MKIVISQPMYFPWVGMFEQIRLSDIFVFYNDVQFSKGSFTNRVQIKAPNSEGYKWLTVPLKGLTLGKLISEVEIDNNKSWKKLHQNLLREFYNGAPFYDDVMELIGKLFSDDYVTIDLLSKKSMRLVIDYFDLGQARSFLDSENIQIFGNSSERVLEIVKKLSGSSYITGHGAINYLNHHLFENNGIDVEYMNYKKKEYPQLWGKFNPYVSILDLIANKGKNGIHYIDSTTMNWKYFMNNSF